MEHWSVIVWSRSNVLALVYLSVFGSLIAFSAYYYLIEKMDATVVSLSTLVYPIVALVLGRTFLHEAITPMSVAGIATILAGVAVAIVPLGRVERQFRGWRPRLLVSFGEDRQKTRSSSSHRSCSDTTAG
jgi:drug/metabolite transporter (DMT)-like permease